MARGVGATLQSLGQDTQQQAMGTLGAAAQQETQRNSQNQMLEAEEKAGRVQLGSTVGALGGFYAGSQVGAVGGPLGALIGGTAGAIAGGLFD